MAQDTSSTKSVSLAKLNSQVQITAYTGFSDKYQTMDQQVCDWVKHNFKGTSLVVERYGKSIEIPVDDLQIKDSLQKIFKFPKELEKLLKVNERLLKELENRGFFQFDVIPLKNKSTAATKKRVESVRKTEEFVQQVKESIQVRDNATNAVENLMDEGRRGKTSTTDIKKYVDDIVTKSSSDAIAAIANLKESDQTYAHCVDVGAIFKVVYNRIIEMTNSRSVFKDEQELLLSSFLHDFGKAKVPKEILDSTVRFDRDSKEMQMIRNHPVYGAELLTKMNMPSYIVDMAHYHHVKLDTTMASSYPENVNFDDIIMEARLIAIIDIYQALVGKRSYKKSWAPPAAMRFIDQLSGVEYDLDLWMAFQKVLGKYPKGSLVELSDESQAFVVSVPEEDLDRPQVVIVRDGSGEDLEHHTFVDLDVDRDLSITKELDNYETFGDKVIEVFANLQVI